MSSVMFDLLSDNLRSKAAEYLVADIKARGNHLLTGFLGTPYLCHVLSSHDRTAVAYDLLLQESFPSWLFPVKMGATTIWERWDGEKPDSTFQDKNMNSFNHYAYGAIGDWLYRVVAGIEILKPGYKQILIQPHPDNRLSYARASFESVYGEIVSGWVLRDGNLNVSVTIPPNASAVVRLPRTTAAQITCNGVSINSPITGFKNVREQNGDTLFEAGSGRYEFRYLYSAE